MTAALGADGHRVDTTFLHGEPDVEKMLEL
jgi:hypothetical protein